MSYRMCRLYKVVSLQVSMEELRVRAFESICELYDEGNLVSRNCTYVGSDDEKLRRVFYHSNGEWYSSSSGVMMPSKKYRESKLKTNLCIVPRFTREPSVLFDCGAIEFKRGRLRKLSLWTYRSLGSFQAALKSQRPSYYTRIRKAYPPNTAQFGAISSYKSKAVLVDCLANQSTFKQAFYWRHQLEAAHQIPVPVIFRDKKGTLHHIPGRLSFGEPHQIPVELLSSLLSELKQDLDASDEHVQHTVVNASFAMLEGSTTS